MIGALGIFKRPRQKQLSDEGVSYGLYAIGKTTPKIGIREGLWNALTAPSYFNDRPLEKTMKSQNEHYD